MINNLYNFIASIINYQYTIFTATGMFAFWTAVILGVLAFRFLFAPMARGSVNIQQKHERRK